MKNIKHAMAVSLLVVFAVFATGCLTTTQNTNNGSSPTTTAVTLQPGPYMIDGGVVSLLLFGNGKVSVGEAFDDDVALGTWRINGNQLLISIISAKDTHKDFVGDYVYIIIDSTSFTLGKDRPVWKRLAGAK